jgi:hypothetical protein
MKCGAIAQWGEEGFILSNEGVPTSKWDPWGDPIGWQSGQQSEQAILGGAEEYFSGGAVRITICGG